MKIIKDIAKAIKKADKIALFHHVGPDGDTLSSSYGLMKAIQKKFPNKEVKWIADTEAIMKRFDYIVSDLDDVIEDIDSSWTAIVGDVAVKERIYGYEIYEKAGFKICFDHHQNTINFDYDLYWQQSDVAASSWQAYKVAEALKVPFDSKVSIGLLYGILTDTNNFVYSLNDPRPVEDGAKLLKHISKEDINHMYNNMRKRTTKDLAFQAFALSNYKVEGNLAYLKITAKDQAKLKIDAGDASRVNLIGNIEGIDMWMFFIEDTENDMIRTSLRSLGFPVTEVAKKFGGGGHIRASGIKLPIDWKMTDKVIAEAKKQLKKHFKK